MAGRITGGASGQADDVTWRQLRRGLWVGRVDDHPLGLIEQGHRFTFTDVEGTSHSGFRTLSEAQEAATGSIPDARCGVERSAPRPNARALAVGLPPRSVTFLLVAAAVLAATCGLLFLL